MDRAPVKISEGGRIVIPIEFRKALGVDIGDELILHMEDGKMLLLTRRQALQYVQDQVSFYKNVQDRRLLADELIAERKIEAADE